jgi:peptidoglycan/xylan/chitin deacetylase (PgdA/CDA1 family)
MVNGRLRAAVGIVTLILLASCQEGVNPVNDTVPGVDGGKGNTGKDGGGVEEGEDGSVDPDPDPEEEDDAGVDPTVYTNPDPGPCTNGGKDAPGATPMTPFGEPQPAYIPNDTVIITIDDGPSDKPDPSDPDYEEYKGCLPNGCTAQVLDTLKAHNMKATFFINSANWTDEITTDSEATGLVRRMLKEGHTVANHTVHHYHLAPGGNTTDGEKHLTKASEIEAEILGVENSVKTITNGGIPTLTLFRAPFGEPYQSGTAADKALVSPVVAKHAVEINWNFDTHDQETTDPEVVFQNFKAAVGTGPGKGPSWGIFLIHATSPQDAKGLPKILDYIESQKFKVASVEDVLCWKFGKHSADIIK